MKMKLIVLVASPKTIARGVNINLRIAFSFSSIPITYL